MEEKSHSSYETRSQSSGSQQPISFTNSKDNVKVMIRVRPLNEREKSNGGSKKCVTVDNDYSVTIEAKPDIKSFNYDFVGDELIDQETIFVKIAKPIADACLEGYNGSIFAYGQTGAGKTFTIQGPAIFVNGEEQIVGSSKEAHQEVEKRGLMQRSFEYIYDMISKQRNEIEAQQSGNFESLVRCSYLEIYNEQIMDLLDPSQINLHLREDIKKGVYVEGLQEEVVASAQDMMSLIQQGAKNRHVGSTSMNKESSRSHSVLTTIIETKSMSEGGVWNIKTSRFHIIDLAGSERSKYTNAVGERLKEAGMINKSLSALGNVINSLVDISEGKSRHVHYRDSKLTFLLRDSLGGNSKTVIIANISPSSICYGETLSTLKFAQRAKLIRNKAIINEDSSGTIQLLKSEISRLKKELAQNEKMYSNVQTPAGGFQCSLCKAIIGPDAIQEEDEEDEMLINNISCCEDIMDKSTNQLNLTSALGTTMVQGGNQINEVLKQKFKNQKEDLVKMRKRVVHLEGLLSANLDNLSSQQKFYDHEIQKHQQQNKKLQQAVESFEKQCARDKMIIKFREDRINKLEQPLTKEQQKDEQVKLIADLRKEITLWKEAADHNSQAAKLFAEKAELQSKFDQLKNEYKQSPDSLQAQMRSLTEMNESLNQYLKLYCEESKKEVENELSRVKLDYAEKIESLNEKINELKLQDEERKTKHSKQVSDLQENITNLKSEVERLEQEFAKEKLDIERQNKEAIEQIKNEIEQISENKTEQEKELQMFKVQLLEKEQLFEREKQTKADLERHTSQRYAEYQQQVTELQRSIEELEQDGERLREKLRLNQEHYESVHDQERKNHAFQIREKEAEWDTKLREIETRMMAESSEKQMIEEQAEQLEQRIKSLEEENETLQQSIIYKEESIKEIETSIREKETQLQELKQQLELALKQNKEETEQLKQTIEKVENERGQLQNQLELALQDKQELQLAINEVKEELQVNKEQLQDLERQIQAHLAKIESQSKRISSLESDLDSKSDQIKTLTEELSVSQLKLVQSETDLNEKITLLESLIENSTQQEQIKNQQYLEDKTKLEDGLKVLEQQVQSLIVSHQDEKKIIEDKHQHQLEQVQISFNKELSVKVQQVCELQSCLEQTKSQLAVAQQEIIQIQTEKDETEDKLTQVQEQVEQTKVYYELEVLKLQETTKQEVEQVKQQLQEEIKLKVEETWKQASQHSETVLELRKLVETKQSEIEAQVQTISKLKDELDLIKEESIKETQSVQESWSIKYEKLEQEFNEVNKKLVSEDQEVVELKAELNRLIEQINQKDSGLHQAQVHLTEVQEELKNQVTLLENQKLQTEQIRTEYETQLKELQEKLNHVEEEKNSLREQILSNEENGTQEIQMLKSKVESLQLQCRSADDQAKDTQSDLTQLKEEKQKMESQLEDRMTIIKDYQTQVVTYTEQIQILNERKIQLKQQVQQSEAIINQFKSQFEEVVNEKNCLSESSAQLEQQLKTVTSQLFEEQAQTESLISQLETLSTQNNDLTQQIQTLEQELQNQQETYNSLDQQSQSTIQNLQQQNQQTTRALVELEQQLHQQKLLNNSNTSELTAETYRLHNELENLTQIYQEKEQAIRQYEEECSNYQLENQDLLTQNQELSQRLDELEQEGLRYQAQIEDDRIKIGEYVQHNQQLQNELKKSRATIEESVDQLAQQHAMEMTTYQQQVQLQIDQSRQEVEQYKQLLRDQTGQMAKLKQVNEEQTDMLKSSKDTMSRMVQKENELMRELEKNINEFREKQEKSKKRIIEIKEERDQLRVQFERLRKENDNLKELVKLKDRQIEDQQSTDESDKQILEKTLKENKDLRNQLTKREFEMRDLVRTLKFYSEEKQKLEKEIEKLNRENDQLIGHKNPSQKIQHHVKIKEENNKLREENFKLQEELRKKIELITKHAIKGGATVSSDVQETLNGATDQSKEEMKKLRKENVTYQETINRVVDHILSQPGLLKAIGISEENNEKLMQQNGPTKVKKAMEIVSLINNYIQSRERDFKDLERDLKKYECRLDIVEKEKALCKQQLEIIQQTGNPGQYQQQIPMRSPINKPQDFQIHSHQQYQQQQLHQQMKPSRLLVEGFSSNTSSNAMEEQAFKQSPSPIINMRQQKEKENVNSKRDLFSQVHRSGSGRRQAYVSGNSQGQMQMHK